MSPFVKLPGGAVAHVLCDRRSTKRCACGRLSTKLCDFRLSPPEQVTHAKTCDKPLCDICAVHIPGKDIDYCQQHADQLGVSAIL